MNENDLYDIEQTHKDFEAFQSTVDGASYAARSAADVPALLAEVKRLRRQLAEATRQGGEWRLEAERMRLQFTVETKRVGILADCLKAGGYHSPDGFHAQPGHGKSCRECNALREALGLLSAEAQT